MHYFINHITYDIHQKTDESLMEFVQQACDKEFARSEQHMPAHLVEFEN